jgi:hypothetical protein
MSTAYHSKPSSPSHRAQRWLLGFDTNLTPSFGSPGPTKAKPKMASKDELAQKIKAGVQAALGSQSFLDSISVIITESLDARLEPLEARVTRLEPLIYQVSQLEPLTDRINLLETDLTSLKQDPPEIPDLTNILSRITDLENQLKASKQDISDEKIRTRDADSMSTAGKCNNLILSGIPIHVNAQDDSEPSDTPATLSPEDSVINIAQKLNIKIGLFSTKLIGKTNNRILIQFNSIWDKRKFYAARSTLAENGFENVFLGEDLLKTQSEIFYHCRQAKRQKLISSTWSQNGSVFLKREGGARRL